MAKTAPKTMRFEEETYDYVMQYNKGENFSEKFHHMVDDIRNDERRLENSKLLLDSQIDESKNELVKLKKQIRNYKELITKFEKVTQGIDEILDLM